MTEAFLKIVNMSISASWLVLAVLVLRLLLKKAPKWVYVLMWGIVAVRLICPFSIESALSLIPSSETISPEIMMDPTPTVTTGIPVLNAALNPVISGSFAPNPGDSANPLQIWIPIASAVWASGAAGMLAYAMISYLRLKKRVSTAFSIGKNIRQSEYVDSPFVLGLIWPVIYLPFRLDSADMEPVIAHELTHIRRKDHWWKPLGYTLLAVHWFNPLMWVAYILLCRDIELACDEQVIAGLDSESRADYTQALVACAVNRRTIAACPLAFGEVGVKERVKSVMNYRKPGFWIIAAALFVCLTVAICFLTDPRDPSREGVLHLGLNAEIIEIDYDNQIMYVSDKDRNSAVFGDRCAVDCDFAASRNNLMYVAYGAPNDVRTIDFSVFEVGDSVIIGMYTSEKEKAINGYAVAEQVQLATQRLGDFHPMVTEWASFATSNMDWDTGLFETTIPAFPGVTFRCTSAQMTAEDQTGEQTLIQGMPVWNACFTDLTGDGKPEICATVSFGSGIVDTHVVVYDYANRQEYTLWDRGISTTICGRRMEGFCAIRSPI